MPLRGENHSPAVNDDAPFFRTLADLDVWAATANFAKPLSNVLSYTPRSNTEVDHTGSRGKLLVRGLY